MEITFERNALYQEVWTTPLTKLAKKYGLSDNGIRKVCKALDIPLPQRGHWARIEAGHTILTPPLPPGKGATRFVSHRSPDQSFIMKNVKENAWLKERKVFESSPENAISVPLELENPHGLVVKTMRALEKYRAALEKSRKRTEGASKARAHWQPSTHAFAKPNWTDYLENGTIQLAGDVLPLSVSLDSADRALRIWDAILKACIRRGMAVSLGASRVLLSVEAETVELRMSESTERVAGSTAGLSELDILFKRHIKNVPTGELRIFIGNQRGGTKCVDAPGKPLEVQLNALLCRVYVRVANEKAWRIRIAEQERLRAIEAKRREAERLAAEERKRQREEQERREAELIAEATAWKQCDMIRAYIEHVSQSILRGSDAVPVHEAIKEWRNWASEVVKRMDPTSRRIRMENM